MLFYTTARRQKEATRRRLPRSLHNRFLYSRRRTKEIRSGKFPADPRWLTCIERTSQNVPREEMRAFFEQYFVQNLSCDEIQYNLYIERSTLFNWRDYFLWYAALEAAALGLITERDGFLCA